MDASLITMAFKVSGVNQKTFNLMNNLIQIVGVFLYLVLDPKILTAGALPRLDRHFKLNYLHNR